VKGLFTQGVALLTDGQTTIRHVRSALRQQGFDIVKEVPAQAEWAFGGPAVVIAFLPAVNGAAVADVVKEPWPDTMGDPKRDPVLFGAWGMGQFGPFAFPGSLARAQEQSWSWEPGRTVPAGHRGFVRIRTSYAFGGDQDPPVLPPDYDPAAELMFLSRAVLALLQAPGVMCYFNPNGEVLRDHAAFKKTWDACAAQGSIPLSLWMNTRFFKVDAGLGLMDSVGNSQLDTRDVEVAFPTARYEPSEIHQYVRNVTQYLLDEKQELKDGARIDGPGDTSLSWRTELLDQAAIEPPRRVLRLYPKAESSAIRKALSALGRGSP
jgi:hypothetical protein